MPAFKRAVVYARLSVANEESVSIERQLEAGSNYARAKGWEVVAQFVDDGVSATHNKPEQRVGWRQVLDYPDSYDAVIVWKVDRLARRVIDFLHADEALQARKAAVVSVEESIDMTTSTGRAFAVMLAVFGQLEAETISARVAGARKHLLSHGRAVGGTVPYGYRTVPNPDGPGYVLAQDPDRIGFLIQAANQALEGKTLYSVKQWLSANAPLPSVSQKRRKYDAWSYSTVERLLRNPILAGMTAYNPGRVAETKDDRNASKVRGSEVLRDELGMPVIDESLAIISADDHRRLVAMLDDKEGNPKRMPRASKKQTSPLLSGVATCGECPPDVNETTGDITPVPMWRGTTAGRAVLTCPRCHQTVSTTQLVPLLEKRLLDERGDEYGIETLTEPGDNSAERADIEAAIGWVTEQMRRDDSDVLALNEQLADLKRQRAKARETPTPRTFISVHRTNVRHDWESATTDLERRAVLLSQIKSLSIHRGKVGRFLDPERVHIKWVEANQFDTAMEEIYSQMQPGDKFGVAL